MGAPGNIILTTWRLYPKSHSYYVKKFFASFQRVFFLLCVVAFFINVGLFVFAGYIRNDVDSFELEILSLINMMLLSFVLLRDPKQNSE
jgi:hypothetical protein